MRWFARSEVICWVFVESSIAAEAHETFAEAAGDRVLACLLCPVCRNLRISLQKRMAQPQKFLCWGDVPYPARQHFHCDRLRELTAKVWETFEYDDQREIGHRPARLAGGGEGSEDLGDSGAAGGFEPGGDLLVTGPRGGRPASGYWVR